MIPDETVDFDKRYYHVFNVFLQFKNEGDVEQTESESDPDK